MAFAPFVRAEDAPADAVKAAAKKLGETSYSWTTSTPAPEGSDRGGSSSEGKTEKDGPVVLKSTMGQRTTEVVIKAGKAAVKTDDGWKSGAELAAARGDGNNGGGGRRFGGGAFAARMAETYKAPSAEAAALAGGVKELKKDGDTITGDLTEEAAKERLTFGRGRGGNGGGNGPTISGAKGTVKFWVKDGVLAKYEVALEGKFEFDGNSRDMKRTTTTEIKEVGTTKLEVPSEAAEKLKGEKPAEVKPAETKPAESK